MIYLKSKYVKIKDESNILLPQLQTQFDQSNIWTWITDGLFLILSIGLDVFTAGAASGSTAALIGNIIGGTTARTIIKESIIGGLNAALDASIDGSQGKNVSLDLLGGIAAPIFSTLGKGASKLFTKLIGLKDFEKLAIKDGSQVLNVKYLNKVYVLNEKYKYPIFFYKGSTINQVIKQQQKLLDNFKLKTKINNRYKNEITQFIQERENVINGLHKELNKIGSEITSISERIRKNIKSYGDKIPSYLLQEQFNKIGEALASFKKFISLLDDFMNPVNTLLNDIFKAIFKRLAKLNYFRKLRIYEQKLQKWLLKDKKFIKSFDALAFAQQKIFNLKVVNSEWISGYRVLYHTTLNNASTPLKNTFDLQIFFKPSATFHFGERGATPEPYGKRPILIRNCSQQILKDWENACDNELAGEYYWQNIHAKYHKLEYGYSTDELRQLVNILPGISIINRINDIKDKITNFSIKTINSTSILTKIINKVARLLPTRQVRFIVRLVSYQLHKPDANFIPISFAREFKRTFSRHYDFIDTLHTNSKKSYKIYKKTKRSIKSLGRTIRL